MDAKTAVGKAIRTFRETRRLSLEKLAAAAGISYQYLSNLETGKENFSIQVFEALAEALNTTVLELTQLAFRDQAAVPAPVCDPRHLRCGVPLPRRLTATAILAAMNETQRVIHSINAGLRATGGQPLASYIQGNNFSGIISNILCNSLDKTSPYRSNRHHKYPDLICPAAGAQPEVGLEVKSTIKIGKGGESHNGHSGWHLVACYRIVGGEIQFVHVMIAELRGHQLPEPDWKYLRSQVNVETGSQRTETYTTTTRGLTKLRDGSIFLDAEVVNFRRWKQERAGEPPPYSIFFRG